jgi:preprotein translocase subunit SecF
MFILKYKYLFLSISLAMVLFSLFLVGTLGLQKSIDFTGGAQAVVDFGGAPGQIQPEMVKSALRNDFGEVKVLPKEDGSFKITLRDMKEEDFQKLSIGIFTLSDKAVVKEFTMKGPSISSEVTQKAILGVILVVLAIIIFVTISFYGVSHPVTSFKYGLITIIALLHDIIIPTGVFAYLGYAQDGQ